MEGQLKELIFTVETLFLMTAVMLSVLCYFVAQNNKLLKENSIKRDLQFQENVKFFTQLNLMLQVMNGQVSKKEFVERSSELPKMEVSVTEKGTKINNDQMNYYVAPDKVPSPSIQLFATKEEAEKHSKERLAMMLKNRKKREDTDIEKLKNQFREFDV